MTPDAFRRLALALPEAVEAGHMGHPDFRVGGKVFATLGAPDPGHATVKLTPDQQEAAIAALPAVFRPAAGAWGRRGYTHVRLRPAKVASVKTVLALAWRNTAPPKLAKQVRVA